MTEITPNAVLLAFSRHIGRERGVSACMLTAEVLGQCNASDADQRNLRHAIEHLRREGHHICGHPSTGYYLAASDAELLDTVRFLHDRAMTSLAQAAAMQRVSLPDLRGQLRIPT